MKNKVITNKLFRKAMVWMLTAAMAVSPAAGSVAAITAYAAEDEEADPHPADSDSKDQNSKGSDEGGKSSVEASKDSADAGSGENSTETTESSDSSEETQKEVTAKDAQDALDSAECKTGTTCFDSFVVIPGDVAWSEAYAHDQEEFAEDHLHWAQWKIVKGDHAIDSTNVKAVKAQLQPKMQPVIAKDADGNAVLDENGKEVAARDENGEVILEAVVDEQGNAVMEPVVDENGNNVPELDADGNPVAAAEGDVVAYVAIDNEKCTDQGLLDKTICGNTVQGAVEEAIEDANEHMDKVGVTDEEGNITEGYIKEIDDKIEIINNKYTEAETAKNNNDLAAVQQAYEDAKQAKGDADIAYDNAVNELEQAKLDVEKAQAALDEAKKIGGEYEAKAQRELDRAIAHAEKAAEAAECAYERVHAAAVVMQKIDDAVNCVADATLKALKESLGCGNADMMSLAAEMEDLAANSEDTELQAAIKEFNEAAKAFAADITDIENYTNLKDFLLAGKDLAELSAKYMAARAAYDVAVKLMEKTILVDENGKVLSPEEAKLKLEKFEEENIAPYEALMESAKALGAKYELDLAAAKIKMELASSEEAKAEAAKEMADLIIQNELKNEIAKAVDTEGETTVEFISAAAEGEQGQKYGQFKDDEGNAMDYWVVTDANGTKHYYAYQLDEEGKHVNIVNLYAFGNDHASIDGDDTKYEAVRDENGNVVSIKAGETEITVSGDDESGYYYTTDEAIQTEVVSVPIVNQATQLTVTFKTYDAVEWGKLTGLPIKWAWKEHTEIFDVSPNPLNKDHYYLDAQHYAVYEDGQWKVKSITGDFADTWQDYNVATDPVNPTEDVTKFVFGEGENKTYADPSATITIDNVTYDVKRNADGTYAYVVKHDVTITPVEDWEKTVTNDPTRPEVIQDIQVKLAQGAKEFASDMAKYEAAKAALAVYEKALEAKKATSVAVVDNIFDAMKNASDIKSVVANVEEGVNIVKEVNKAFGGVANFVDLVKDFAELAKINGAIEKDKENIKNGDVINGTVQLGKDEAARVELVAKMAGKLGVSTDEIWTWITTGEEPEKIKAFKNIQNSVENIQASMKMEIGLEDFVELVKQLNDPNSFASQYIGAVKEVITTGSAVAADAKKQLSDITAMTGALVKMVKAVVKSGSSTPAALSLSDEAMLTQAQCTLNYYHKNPLVIGTLAFAAGITQLNKAVVDCLNAKVQKLDKEAKAAADAAAEAERILKELKLKCKSAEIAAAEQNLAAAKLRWEELNSALEQAKLDLEEAQKKLGDFEELLKKKEIEVPGDDNNGTSSRHHRSRAAEVLGARREDMILPASEGEVLGAHRAPKTGDNSRAILWALVMGCSTIGVAAMLAKKKEQN